MKSRKKFSAMKEYILQASFKDATDEEIDILWQAYLIERKYSLTVDVDTAPKVSYQNYYNQASEGPYEIRIYDRLIFDTCEEAGKVYDAMLTIATLYGCLTVNDYYELSDMAYKSTYAYNDYGWSLKEVLRMRIRPYGHYFTIDIPAATRALTRIKD